MTSPVLDPSTSPVLDPARFSSLYLPTLPLLNLSADERAAVTRLEMLAWRQRYLMLLADSYYRGEQIIANLGIAIPPELQGIRVLVGWPRFAVDPYVEKLALDCFRVANATTADPTLRDVWTANGMDGEMSIGFLESLVMGRSWYVIGPGDEPGDAPRVTVESPLNIVANWDLRGHEPIEALQSYWNAGRRHAALMLPNTTIHLAEDDQATWQIVDRDDHGFGAIPLVRQANRPRGGQRDGESEITPHLMSITDAACRTLLNLTVAGEFYSVPQKLILGATEDDFINSDGEKKSAWDTYISRILALQRDEEGELPQIHQFDAYDPSVFTKVIEMFAGQAAGIMAALPQDLGLYTTGNPVSPDSLDASEGRRNQRTRRMQSNFGAALVKTGQWVMRYLAGGPLPNDYRALSADWADPSIPNFTKAADGLSKLATAGFLPPGSDVARKRAGFNAVERAQLAAETDAAQQALAEIGTAVEDKAIRAANALANAAGNALPPAAAPEPPAAA